MLLYFLTFLLFVSSHEIYVDQYGQAYQITPIKLGRTSVGETSVPATTATSTTGTNTAADGNPFAFNTFGAGYDPEDVQEHFEEQRERYISSANDFRERMEDLDLPMGNL